MLVVRHFLKPKRQQRRAVMNRLLLLLLVIDLIRGSRLRSLAGNHSRSNSSNNTLYNNGMLFNQIPQTNQNYTNDTIIPTGLIRGEPPYSFPAIGTISIPPHVSLPRTISRFDIMGEHITDKTTNERTVIIMIVDARHLSLLRQEGYRVNIDVAETKRLALAQQQQATTPLSRPDVSHLTSSSLPSTPNAKSYTRISFRECMRDLNGTYESLYDFIRNDSYKNLTRVKKIGESFLRKQNNEEGYDLLVLQVSNFNSPINPKAIFFILSGLHARELAPVEVAVRFATELIEGYGINADITQILDHVEIHFLFQSNPDAREVVEAKPLANPPRRKNMNFDGARCPSWDPYYQPGVDLNRNFPFEYGRPSGASRYKCESDYHGVGPGSEPEVQAIINYTRSVFPEEQQRWYDRSNDVDNNIFTTETTGLFIDIHSWGNLILWPWFYRNLTTPHHSDFEILGDKFQRLTKYSFGGGGYPDFMYPASGTSLDWAYANLGCAAFILELGREWFERCGYFEKEVAPTTLKLLYYAAKVARQPYEISKGPDVREIYIGYPSDGEDVVRRNETLYVETTVDARRKERNVFREDETDRIIHEVRLFVDEHPYNDDNNTGFLLMEPLDEKFDSVSEKAYYELPMMTYVPGKHILHITARDSEGHEGPISSMFFHVID